MADITALKNRIRAAIKANDNQEITGPVLQNALLDVVDELNRAAITETDNRQSGDSTLQQGINTERQQRQDADTALGQRITEESQQRQNGDTQLNNLITGIKNNIDNGYVYAGIATPSTVPVSGKVFYIATAAGTYTNFDGQVLTQGINILRNRPLTDIDNEPVNRSNNILKSGSAARYNGASWVKEQVLFTDGGVFDISAYYATDGTLATYADLSAALGTNGENIPQSLRKGGMSVKFVQSSDNKYVQYRLMTTSFSTNESDWQNIGLVQQVGLSETVAMSQKAVTEALDSVLQTASYIKKTYAELKKLYDDKALVPGQVYRLTDYAFTTVQTGTKSAGHNFDLLLRAATASTFEPIAAAAVHDGDSYFTNAGAELDKWMVWYDLDNNTDKYAWADATNGKGVIYRLVDEHQNDCGYDFKNAMFYQSDDFVNARTGKLKTVLDSNSEHYYYTFSTVSSDKSKLLDHSSDKGIMPSCAQMNFVPASKSIGVSDAKQEQCVHLPGNILATAQEGIVGIDSVQCYDFSIGNTFSVHSTGNIVNNALDCVFGDFCRDNVFNTDYCVWQSIFKGSFYQNVFTGQAVIESKFTGNTNNCTFKGMLFYNTFSGFCQNSTFSGDCENNTFSGYCKNNTFSGDCHSNTFSGNCENNTFSGNCENNTFSGFCQNNTFSGNCQSNTFSGNCKNNTFSGYCSNTTFSGYCSNNTFSGQINRCYFTAYFQNNVIESNNGGLGISYCHFDGTYVRVKFKGTLSSENSGESMQFYTVQGMYVLTDKTKYTVIPVSVSLFKTGVTVPHRTIDVNADGKITETVGGVTTVVETTEEAVTTTTTTTTTEAASAKKALLTSLVYVPEGEATGIAEGGGIDDEDDLEL